MSPCRVSLVGHFKHGPVVRTVDELEHVCDLAWCWLGCLVNLHVCFLRMDSTMNVSAVFWHGQYDERVRICQHTAVLSSIPSTLFVVCVCCIIIPPPHATKSRVATVCQPEQCKYLWRGLTDDGRTSFRIGIAPPTRLEHLSAASAFSNADGELVANASGPVVANDAAGDRIERYALVAGGGDVVAAPYLYWPS